jgi:hypothetical protein
LICCSIYGTKTIIAFEVLRKQEEKNRMTLETCTNCESQIGHLEKAYIYQGKIVCEKCNDRLNKKSHANFMKSSDSLEKKQIELLKPVSRVSTLIFWIIIIILAFWLIIGLLEGLTEMHKALRGG